MRSRPVGGVMTTPRERRKERLAAAAQHQLLGVTPWPRTRDVSA
jgi:hypothetical protein